MGFWALCAVKECHGSRFVCDAGQCGASVCPRRQRRCASRRPRPPSWPMRRSSIPLSRRPRSIFRRSGNICRAWPCRAGNCSLCKGSTMRWPLPPTRRWWPDDALVALAQQLSDSFAQLRASGVDAGQLAMTAGSQDDLAQRFALLSGQVTPGASEALAQNTDALTQADLARIGIDLQNNRPVDVAALQAAFEADRVGTLNRLAAGQRCAGRSGRRLDLAAGRAVRRAGGGRLTAPTIAANPGRASAASRKAWRRALAFPCRGWQARTAGHPAAGRAGRINTTGLNAATVAQAAA